MNAGYGANRTRNDSGSDGQLNEALKPGHTPLLSSLSDTDNHSDNDKKPVQVTETRSIPEKTKTVRRGRPRKLTKSPKTARQASENEASSGKNKRGRPPRVSSMKKKAPISKPTVSSSDEASNSHSHGVSSDSDSDHPSPPRPAASPISVVEKRRARRSTSSSDDDIVGNKGSSSEERRPPPSFCRSSIKKQSIDRENTMKKNKVPDESLSKKLPKVARVSPRPRPLPTRTTSSADNSDSDISAAPKVREERESVQDKKKSDTLRMLFSRSGKTGGKGGGKGGKGGKGGGKCGIYVEELTSATTPTGGESPYKRPSSRMSLPPLTYNVDGNPSLMCRVALTRLSHIPPNNRGQLFRERTELPDTRPSSRLACLPPPRPPTPEDGEILDTPPADIRTRNVIGEGQVKSMDSVAKQNCVKVEQVLDVKSNSAASHASHSGSSCGVNGCGASGSGGSVTKRKRNTSCSSVSSLSTVCSVESKAKNSSEHKKKRKRKHAESQCATPRPSSSQVR